jgi:bifunctional non-homologous end joining protein LigD
MPPPRSQVRFIARTLPGAVTAPYPGFVAPMLATLRKAPPRGAKWLHEIAFDGMRVQPHLVEGRASLFSADGGDCTERFGAIAEAAKALPANHAIIDGVIVGPPDKRSGAAVCYVFDLLFLDGFDIRAAPLAERKRVLQGFLAEAREARVIYSEHLANGAAMLRHAREIGARGIVSKSKEVPYRSGRTPEWLFVT